VFAEGDLPVQEDIQRMQCEGQRLDSHEVHRMSIEPVEGPLERAPPIDASTSAAVGVTNPWRSAYILVSAEQLGLPREAPPALINHPAGL
jgi:hypothetical protein